MNVLIWLYKWMFSPSDDTKNRKVIPSHTKDCVRIIPSTNKNITSNSVTTSPVTDNISMNSLGHLPRFVSEDNVVSLLDLINRELYVGKFQNSSLSHMLYSIVKDIKNYKKLSHNQLEYIKSLNREQLYFLFMLSNQMIENLEAALNKVGSSKYVTSSI